MELKRSSKEVKESKNTSIAKFLKSFPDGFSDENYLSWERDFKWQAHERWLEALNQKEFKRLMMDKEYKEIAVRALAVESRTNLLLPVEKMALRDAIKDDYGAEIFAKALYQFLFGTASLEQRFTLWCDAFDELPGVKGLEETPRNKTKIISWPVLTVFAFLAQPKVHAYLKPDEANRAAEDFGNSLRLRPDIKPNWASYSHYLAFCEEILLDLSRLKPRDMIDAQSFIRVLGSDEY